MKALPIPTFASWLSALCLPAPAWPDLIDGFVVSDTSNLAPGVDLWAGVKYQDYQSRADDPASENEALFDMIGTSVSF